MNHRPSQQPWVSKLRTALLTTFLEVGLAPALGAESATAAAPKPQSNPLTSAPWLDRSHDRVIEFAVAPAADDRHAEVRLIDRGGIVVMQTLIHTRYLKRVTGKIRDKEEESWSGDRPGHEASRQYVDELMAARDVMEERFKARTDRANRYRTLLIEFILSPQESVIVLADPRVEVDEDRWTLTGAETLKVLRPPREYVRANIVAIGVDNFALSHEAMEEHMDAILDTSNPTGERASGP